MKKIFCLMLSLGLVFGAAGCGKEKKEAPKKSETIAEEKIEEKVEVKEEPEGEKVAEGLLKTENGKYMTEDGRLEAEAGYAMVIRDGESYTAKVEYETNSKSERLWVKEYFENEELFMSAPLDYIAVGDNLGFDDVAGNRSGKRPSEGSDFYWKTPYINILFSDGYYSPSTKDNNIYEDAALKKMYVDEKGNIVFYLKFNTVSKPENIEMLAVVDITKDSSYISPSQREDNSTTHSSSSAGIVTADDEKTIRLKAGDSVKIEMSVGRIDYMYEVYNWFNGGDAGTISTDTDGRYCTVTALRSGTATVTGECIYGVREPDILTGNERTAEHSRTIEWTIVVE